MVNSRPAGSPDEFDPYATRTERQRGFVKRRREKVLAEIERNRRGEYKIPTWVMGAALLAIVLVWVALLVFG